MLIPSANGVLDFLLKKIELKILKLKLMSSQKKENL